VKGAFVAFAAAGVLCWGGAGMSSAAAQEIADGRDRRRSGNARMLVRAVDQGENTDADEIGAIITLPGCSLAVSRAGRHPGMLQKKDTIRGYAGADARRAVRARRPPSGVQQEK
jgi:hypothetical protein